MISEFADLSNKTMHGVKEIEVPTGGTDLPRHRGPPEIKVVSLRRRNPCPIAAIAPRLVGE